MNQVRPYAITCMESLGYREHQDAFSVENIPSTLIDGSFHVVLGTSRQQSMHSHHVELVQPFIVQLFKQGYRDPQTRMDEGITESRTVIQTMLDTSRRTEGENIKNVTLRSADVDPLDATNDNAILFRFEFEALVLINLTGEG